MFATSTLATTTASTTVSTTTTSSTTPQTSATTGLSDTQITAILSLLESFGADTSTIANVQSALGETVAPSLAQPSPKASAWQRNLSLHDTGNDVKSLQQFLSVTPTGYFGMQTYQALMKYQKSVGLPATGYFGVMTRGKVGS